MAEARIVPLIPVSLDKPRTLLFDHLAVKLIEIELTRLWNRDYTFYQALRLCAEMLQDNDLSKLSFVNVSVMLWAGCLHEDPMLRQETVDKALPYTDPSLLIPYVGLILQAWQAGSPTAPPVPDGSEVVDTNPLDASTGTISGALSATVSA